MKETYCYFHDGYWRFTCKYYNCPNNCTGVCKTKYKDFPKDLIHEFDGKNIIKCLCG